MQYLLQTKSENLLKACHARVAMSASVNYTWETGIPLHRRFATCLSDRRSKVKDNLATAARATRSTGGTCRRRWAGFVSQSEKNQIKGHLSNFGLVSRKLNGLFCLLTRYLQVNLSKSNNPVQGTNTAGATEKKYICWPGKGENRRKGGSYQCQRRQGFIPSRR